MIYLVLFLSLFAHEDLDSTVCTLGKEKIVITKNKTNYSILMPGTSKPSTFKTPTLKDWYDPKNKQLFDTYTFSKEKNTLVVKRPETKGSVKTPFAEWNGKKYSCK